MVYYCSGIYIHSIVGNLNVQVVQWIMVKCYKIMVFKAGSYVSCIRYMYHSSHTAYTYYEWNDAYIKYMRHKISILKTMIL